MKKARYFLIIAIIFIDQLVKFTVRNEMFTGETIPIIEDVFHITFVKNTGAAFNMFEGASIFLFIVPLIAILIAFWYMEKNIKEHETLTLSLVLIISGGIGNLIDRTILGYVTDMFDFRVFPVFNVADIAICVGAFLLVVYMFHYDTSSVTDEKDK